MAAGELILRLISLAMLDHKVIEEKPDFHEIFSMEIRYELFDIIDKLDEINLNGSLFGRTCAHRFQACNEIV